MRMKAASSKACLPRYDHTCGTRLITVKRQNQRTRGAGESTETVRKDATSNAFKIGRLACRMLSLRGIRRGRPPAYRFTSRTLATHATHDSGRVNEVAVPLISQSLRKQLFPSRTSPFAPPPPSKKAVSISREHLSHHNLLVDPPATLPPATSFQLPSLLGPTISHHFHSLGENASSEHKQLITDYIASTSPPQPLESSWCFTPGWTLYHTDGSFEPISYPPESEQVLVFDVETLPHVGGDWAVMAVALGTRGWYSWTSPWLTGHSSSPAHLIPLGPDRGGPETGLMEGQDVAKRIVVGHNVLFDRARVKDEYTLKRPSTRWLDTMSLHVAVSGLTSPQRPTWMAYRKDRDSVEVPSDQSPDSTPKPTQSAKGKTPPKTWREMASMNSLDEVARLHCGIRHDKAPRNILIDPSTTLDDLRAQFSVIMSYCASDVAVTRAVLCAVMPKFLETCPHPASLAGALLMSQPVLPVDSRWPQYLERADTAYAQRLDAVRDKLHLLAEEARKLMGQRDAAGNFVWESDVQLRQLDWSPKRARRLPRSLSKAAKELAASPNSLESSVDTVSIPSIESSEDIPEPPWCRKCRKVSADSVDLDSPLTAILLETTYRGFPLVHLAKDGWAIAVPKGAKKFKAQAGEEEVTAPATEWSDHRLYTLPAYQGKGRLRKLFGRGASKKIEDGVLGCFNEKLLLEYLESSVDEYRMAKLLQQRIDTALKSSEVDRQVDPWLRQLDWGVKVGSPSSTQSRKKQAAPDSSVALGDSANRGPLTQADLVWPKWYWDLDQADGSGLELTIKKRATPLLLKLLWRDFPVVHSREHGWVYRVPTDKVSQVLEHDLALRPLSFKLVCDSTLADESSGDEPLAEFFQLPHPDGDENNVGNPLSRAFLGAAEDGVLSSVYPVAREALQLNAECSYWAAARERIVNQLVVWQGDPALAPPPPADTETQGLILPQVIPMGTITRRAVERTWLTASNAKKNRVGSELKAMVRAPPGYAIVGADVDSEELWICAVMGDAQFGIHGATAVGWMTLEGTKSAGTDLHSKTASILGISRDHAKAFNYSRIYGAGVKHAVQLLLKANPALTKLAATELVNKLYASTKGLTYRGVAHGASRSGGFWHGGTESFVFNKLEEIAKSDTPKTPAFGCGLTTALTSKYLPAEGRSKKGEAYMPSRINWVVQSSGVDYLHALLVAMEWLTTKFGIDARYMISVHDEIRYLVKEEDKYRAALALQIANLWTRALFCYRLQMDDLPQSCAFFSAVDVDSCFRKEVNMTCVTPSNPDAIPFGESLDIEACLAATSGGSLLATASSTANHEVTSEVIVEKLSPDEVSGKHRAPDIAFLAAQTTSDSKGITDRWARSRRSAKRTGSQEYRREAWKDLPWINKQPAPVVDRQSAIEAIEDADEDFIVNFDVPDEVYNDRFDESKAATQAASP